MYLTYIVLYITFSNESFSNYMSVLLSEVQSSEQVVDHNFVDTKVPCIVRAEGIIQTASEHDPGASHSTHTRTHSPTHTHTHNQL